MRSTVIALTAFLVLALATLGCGAPPPPATTAASAPPPGMKAVVNMRTLMNSLIEKQSNIVWEAVGEVHTAEGLVEKQPRTDEEWQNVRDAAVAVTEGANLLLIPPRARDAEWVAATAGLIAEGERMIAAIDRKNTKEVFDVGADIYEACVRCHRQYMPGVRELYR